MMRPTFPALVALLLAGPALSQEGNPMLDTLFLRLDANADGVISGEETAATKTRQFNRADRDGDGILSAAEYARVKARLDRAKVAMDVGHDRLDADGDGALSLAEYTARSPIFALVDANGDGALSRAEAERAAAILQP
jgi:Ca2+-binding EF-hand superfamily protein